MSSSGTKSTSNDSSTYEFSPSESLDSDSEIVSSSHELLNSSSARTSLEAFPRAWLTTRLVKISHTSAYLEITLFQVHFQLVVRKRFHIFFIFQEILDGRALLSLTFFSPLHPRTQGALHNFYMQSRPR